MSLLQTPKVSTKIFSYDKKKQEFYEEISTLVANGFTMSGVYDDAIDQGFTLVSEKSGKEVRLVNSHTEVRNGDILWNEYSPVEKKDMSLGFKVIIYND